MATYIQNAKHFVNYLKKALRLSGEPSDMLDENFYVEYIYDRGLADAFAWALKQDGVALLSEPRVLAWLSAQSRASLDYPDWKHEMCSEFVDTCDELATRYGLYSFWNENDTCLYVGRSTANLGQRILSSLERLKYYDRSVYLRYILTQTKSDAILAEVYFINRWKPALNLGDCSDMPLTIEIVPVPKWSDRLRICTVERTINYAKKNK